MLQAIVQTMLPVNGLQMEGSIHFIVAQLAPFWPLCQRGVLTGTNWIYRTMAVYFFCNRIGKMEPANGAAIAVMVNT